MYAIIGSGFGLYGYLPAILNSGFDTVLLEEKYKNIFKKRADLKEYIGNIKWVQTRDEVIQLCDHLVLATKPSSQFDIISSLDSFHNIKRINLEKPIANNFDDSFFLINKIKSAKIPYDVNYSFLYLDWFNKIRNIVQCSRDFDISIKWHFKAHHIENNQHKLWKNQINQGGGIINFYGIHFIALVAQLGCFLPQSSITSQTCEKYTSKWIAVFSKSGGYLKVLIDCNSTKNSFSIQRKDEVIFEKATPFGSIQIEGKKDVRVFCLQKFLNSDCKSHSFNEKVLLLWKEILILNKNTKL